MRKFLVIGESCTDVFVYGKCERLSPEAPVPVFQPVGEVRNRGMAGNVAENLKALIGRTQSKGEVYEWLSDPSDITKTRFVDKKSNHIFLRVDVDKVKHPFRFSPDLSSRLSQADIVIVSDYDKGFLSRSDILTIARERKDSAVAILDTKRSLDESILASYDFVKLNEHEAARSAEIVASNPEKVIVTLGGRGARVMNTEFLVDEVETIDVSGAGDTFFASFGFEYLESKDVKRAVEFANSMASIVVRKRGVSTV